jgi:asparagine synthase (glutamine-hydrolysing)
MGDFLLDFRDRSQRCKSAESLRFYPDMEVDRVARDAFALFVSRVGRRDLWAPFESPDGVVVGLAGRLALDASEWESASRVDGEGGLACKAVYQAYRNRGVEGLHGFSGGFAIHLHDPGRQTYHLVTDRAGAFPCYSTTAGELLCSHPDILAGLLDRTEWDLTSMAQFIATGVVSFPRSYYRDVTALEFGCIHNFRLNERARPRRSVSRYANCEPDGLSGAAEDEIAERLAQAMITASRRRTLPVLGRTAVALSGGLDSRAILCGAERHPELFAFCAFDEQNAEFRSAKAIADGLGVEFLPFKRSFDHYGDNAEMGARISGGMGELASNHFLGFREKLGELGVENLVTGCYFDYLFKSLSLDAREKGLLRRERFGEFSFESYLPHFAVAPRFENAVRERMNALYPEVDRNAATAVARARIAARRTFPLYHEGDNAQRLVPQRVMGWYTPAVDPAVLELARTTPPEMKLNRRVYLNAVRRVCGEAISQIPDANTGLPLSAPPVRVALNRYCTALRRRIERRRKTMATEESWPNWGYYIRASVKLRTLWQRPNQAARELVGELCGEPFRDEIAGYLDRPSQYFMRLFTLKLWFDQRTRSD